MEVIRQYSPDQRAIIESPTKGITSVLAYAGCGKSTTIIGYALARIRMPILYLCFNRSVAIEARHTFKAAGATNVTPMTMHGLAHAEFGEVFKDRILNRIDPAQVEGFINYGRVPELTKRAVALFALKTIEAYCNSADRGISNNHLPLEDIWGARLNEQLVLKAARELWQAMMKYTTCPVTHSVYMKLYQLSEPDLSQHFKIIAVDEGQDLNPVVEAILLVQTIPILIVGDPHQSIYQFRGAVNALEADYISQTYYLNESYRFGPEHAKLATQILTDFKGVEKPLIGKGRSKSIILPSLEVNTIIHQGEPGLEIYRTNGALFQRAVELAVPERDKKTGVVMEPLVKAIKFIGGFDSYQFEDLIAAYMLFKSDKGVKKFQAYKTWSDYCRLAELTSDPEMNSTQKTVERFMGAIPVYVNQLKSVATTGKAPISLTTAHKSKGLEADTVIIGDDFPSLLDEDGTIEEVHLQYVGVTRAKQKLGLPGKMIEDLRLEI